MGFCGTTGTKLVKRSNMTCHLKNTFWMKRQARVSLLLNFREAFQDHSAQTSHDHAKKGSQTCVVKTDGGRKQELMSCASSFTIPQPLQSMGSIGQIGDKGWFGAAFKEGSKGSGVPWLFKKNWAYFPFQLHKFVEPLKINWWFPCESLCSPPAARAAVARSPP